MPDPLPIPRRLAFRALADALGGQARRLESLTPGRSAGRRGPDAAAGAESKREARLRAARELRVKADVLTGWASDDAACRSDGLDAAILGYLVAISYDHGPALAELREELAEAGRPGLIDGLKSYELLRIVARICEIAEPS